ncbi:hypothetical protein SAMN05443144_107166 [Fodinibius roseus]|uniref:Uncharacterized protein n=1 Tax=Fodinibius roseus TaxID=1194090 RepID=A0A1M5ATF0_9BACT|nr:hypothetical protein SAMN05443144_107166 [Fodinibius roseus]
MINFAKGIIFLGGDGTKTTRFNKGRSYDSEPRRAWAAASRATGTR